MKKSLFIILLSLAGIAGLVFAKNNSTSATGDEKTATLKWDTKEINVGTIAQDAPLDLVFHFTNTGNSPVIVNSVRTSCGCTAAKHAEAPIMPGETSEIKVKYDTHRIGYFNKSITVQTSNSEEPTVLYIKGTVE